MSQCTHEGGTGTRRRGGKLKYTDFNGDIKARQDKARQDKARQDKQGKAGQTRQGRTNKARQDKQGKAGQGKADMDRNTGE